ncbi:MAG TPA: CHASE domain-containing protein, partial [Motiliproteus sp.]
MDSGLARKQPHRRLLPLYLLYASLCCATLLFTVFIERERLQDQFVADAKEVFRHADVKAKTFEICLDGFANYLGAQPSLDYDKAQRFAATIRTSYPELYMLELAELVHASERSSFEAKIRQRGYPNFSIHSFDHSGERIERPVPDAPYYFPITFIEPYRDDLATVLGLDLLYSSPELRNAVTDTTLSGRQQASQPFYLVEGGLGYLLHHPFRLAEEQQERAYFALAVVRIADLFTPELLADPQWRVQVEHYQKELDISPRWEHTRPLSQRPG